VPAQSDAGAGRDEARQAGVLVWGKVAAKLSEALVPLAIARLLGQAEVGAFATLLVVYNTALVFLTAGFPRAVIYFLAGREPADRRAIMRELHLVLVGLGVLGALALAAFGAFAAPWLQEVGAVIAGTDAPAEGDLAASLVHLPWLGLYALFDVPTRLIPNWLIAERRAAWSAGSGVLRSIGSMIAQLVPAALSFGVAGMARRSG
jgi:O-antigen/teichoic acid export membrane protein